MNKQKTLNDVKKFYQSFDAKQVESLDDIYSDHIVFVDPFHRIEGISRLKTYFRNMAENTNFCRFYFKHEAINHDDVFLQWRMEFSHPKIKRNAPLAVEGVSHLIIRDKVDYHRDFFDSAEMLYRHIPLLGSVIRQIEKNVGT